MYRSRLWPFFLCILFFFSFSTSAGAQEEDRERAQQEMQEGGVAFEAGNYKEALRHFQLASQYAPDASGPWRWMGRTHHLLGNYAEAKAAYEEYLRRKPGAPDTGEIKGYLAEVEKKLKENPPKPVSFLSENPEETDPDSEEELGLLEISIDVAGAKIEIDGKKVGKTPLKAPQKLAPGTYTVTIQKRGFETLREEVNITANRTTTLEETLTPVKGPQKGDTTEEPTDKGGNKTLGVALLSVGVAGFGAGAVGGIGALNTKQEIEDFVNDNNNVVEFLDFQALQKKGQLFNIITIAGFSAGALGVGSGLFALLNGGKKESSAEASSRLLFLPLSDGGLASFSLSF